MSRLAVPSATISPPAWSTKCWHALVVEVLAPSTADVDRRDKAVAYAQASSLRLLVLVGPDTRQELAHPADGAIDVREPR